MIVLILFILLVLAIRFGEPVLGWSYEQGIPPYIAQAILNFLIYLLGGSIVVRILAYLYRKRKKIPRGQKDNVLLGLQNVFYLITTSVLIVTILALFGIDMVALFTSLSIVAAAIAIVTKDYLNEIISGIIISFSRVIALDDYIKINGQKGTIIDLNLTKLTLLSDDDEVIFIPNHNLFTGEIINYTRKEINKVNIEFELDIKLLSSVEELEKQLIELMEEFRASVEEGSQNIKIAEIRKDVISLKFQYILKENKREPEREIRKKILRYIVNYVKKSSANVPAGEGKGSF